MRQILQAALAFASQVTTQKVTDEEYKRQLSALASLWGYINRDKNAQNIVPDYRGFRDDGDFPTLVQWLVTGSSPQTQPNQTQPAFTQPQLMAISEAFLAAQEPLLQLAANVMLLALFAVPSYSTISDSVLQSAVSFATVHAADIYGQDGALASAAAASGLHRDSCLALCDTPLVSSFPSPWFVLLFGLALARAPGDALNVPDIPSTAGAAVTELAWKERCLVAIRHLAASLRYASAASPTAGDCASLRELRRFTQDGGELGPMLMRPLERILLVHGASLLELMGPRDEATETSYELTYVRESIYAYRHHGEAIPGRTSGAEHQFERRMAFNAFIFALIELISTRHGVADAMLAAETWTEGLQKIIILGSRRASTRYCIGALQLLVAVLLTTCVEGQTAAVRLLAHLVNPSSAVPSSLPSPALRFSVAADSIIQRTQEAPGDDVALVLRAATLVIEYAARLADAGELSDEAQHLLEPTGADGTCLLLFELLCRQSVLSPGSLPTLAALIILQGAGVAPQSVGAVLNEQEQPAPAAPHFAGARNWAALDFLRAVCLAAFTPRLGSTAAVTALTPAFRVLVGFDWFLCRALQSALDAHAQPEPLGTLVPTDIPDSVTQTPASAAAQEAAGVLVAHGHLAHFVSLLHLLAVYLRLAAHDEWAVDTGRFPAGVSPEQVCVLLALAFRAAYLCCPGAGIQAAERHALAAGYIDLIRAGIHCVEQLPGLATPGSAGAAVVAATRMALEALCQQHSPLMRGLVAMLSELAPQEVKDLVTPSGKLLFFRPLHALLISERMAASARPVMRRYSDLVDLLELLSRILHAVPPQTCVQEITEPRLPQTLELQPHQRHVIAGELRAALRALTLLALVGLTQTIPLIHAVRVGGLYRYLAVSTDAVLILRDIAAILHDGSPQQLVAALQLLALDPSPRDSLAQGALTFPNVQLVYSESPMRLLVGLLLSQDRRIAGAAATAVAAILSTPQPGTQGITGAPTLLHDLASALVRHGTLSELLFRECGAVSDAAVGVMSPEYRATPLLQSSGYKATDGRALLEEAHTVLCPALNAALAFLLTVDMSSLDEWSHSAPAPFVRLSTDMTAIPQAARAVLALVQHGGRAVVALDILSSLSSVMAVALVRASSRPIEDLTSAASALVSLMQTGVKGVLPAVEPALALIIGRISDYYKEQREEAARAHPENLAPVNTRLLTPVDSDSAVPQQQLPGELVQLVRVFSGLLNAEQTMDRSTVLAARVGTALQMAAEALVLGNNMGLATSLMTAARNALALVPPGLAAETERQQMNALTAGWLIELAHRATQPALAPSIHALELLSALRFFAPREVASAVRATLSSFIAAVQESALPEPQSEILVQHLVALLGFLGQVAIQDEFVASMLVRAHCFGELFSGWLLQPPFPEAATPDSSILRAALRGEPSPLLYQRVTLWLNAVSAVISFSLDVLLSFNQAGGWRWSELAHTVAFELAQRAWVLFSAILNTHVAMDAQKFHPQITEQVMRLQSLVLRFLYLAVKPQHDMWPGTDFVARLPSYRMALVPPNSETAPGGIVSERYCAPLAELRDSIRTSDELAKAMGPRFTVLSRTVSDLATDLVSSLPI